MTWTVLGVLILCGVGVGLFAVTANAIGWRAATAGWGFAIATTGAVVLALWLISGGPSS